MKCNAPTQIVFIISLVLAILSLLGVFGVLGSIGLGVIASYSYWLAFASWAVLAAGCLLKGL